MRLVVRNSIVATSGNRLKAGIGRRLRFLSRYIQRPSVVGAVAPSSRALSAAVAEPYRRCGRRCDVLEVGAGTGPVTRHLGKILKPNDTLDICEIEHDFADILERDVLSSPDFTKPKADGRVRVLRHAIQELSIDKQYDFVISGLPLTAFELSDVEEVFDVIRRCLKPGGVFSYFEYIGLRRTSRVLSVGKKRARVRAVSRYLTSNIREHEFARDKVIGNLPPAYARHLRFETTSA
jgi:phosphatidylethanolamine/phosphatidyl-N-methylethanolamine N-methyltransferase